MPYHIRISTKSSNHDEVRLDLSEDELEARFLAPYREGRSIVIGGRTIPPEDIARLRITWTDQPSSNLEPIVRAEQAASPVLVIGGPSIEWMVADKGQDVTDKIVTGPQGSGAHLRTVPQFGHPTASGPKVVFVVHGRNAQARDAIFAFLRAIGLYPLEWAEALAATGKASPYIGEVLETAFSIAQAVVVLLTPDDEAYLRPALRGPGDPPHETELTGQARANVIFEAGMAMGRAPDRTILVELGSLRPFSDVAGRHVVRLDNSTARRQELARRLETAGCPVNLTTMAWHTEGDFVEALRLAPAADRRRPLTVERIIREVAAYYTTEPAALTGKGRAPKDVIARQVAAYLIRELTPSSLPVVGAALGGRDHTTALRMIDRIVDDLDDNPALAAEVAELRNRLD